MQQPAIKPAARKETYREGGISKSHHKKHYTADQQGEELTRLPRNQQHQAGEDSAHIVGHEHNAFESSQQCVYKDLGR